jgi:hypothetical protein
MRKLFVPVVAFAVLTFATASFAQNAPTKIGDSAKGKVLTDGKGMTLYTFDKVQAGPEIDRLEHYESRAWTRQMRAMRNFIEISRSIET